MSQELYRLRKVANTTLFPFSLAHLAKLVKKGEFKKEGLLHYGENYIMATNTNPDGSRATWMVSREELEAWRERAELIHNNSIGDGK